MKYMTMIIVRVITTIFITLSICAAAQPFANLPSHFQSAILNLNPTGNQTFSNKSAPGLGIVYDAYTVTYARWYSPLVRVYLSFTSMSSTSTVYSTLSNVTSTGPYALLNLTSKGSGSASFNFYQLLSDSSPGITSITVNVFIIDFNTFNFQCPGCLRIILSDYSGNTTSMGVILNVTGTLPTTNLSHYVIPATFIQCYYMLNWNYNKNFSNYQFNITIEPLPLASSFGMKVYFRSNHPSPSAIYVGIRLNIFVFDKDAIQFHTSMKVYNHSNFIYGASGSSSISSLTTSTTKYAVLIGACGFTSTATGMDNANRSSSFSYGITFNSDFSLSLSLSAPTDQEVRGNVLLFTQEFCPDTAPYDYSGTCVADCTATAGYYHNYSIKACAQCTGQFCKTCSETNPDICLTCDPATYRSLNTSVIPAACVANVGYYESTNSSDPNSTALPCPYGCMSCTNSTTACDCLTGYTWNSTNNSCSPALTNCLNFIVNPLNSTDFICILCVSEYKLVGKTCILQCVNPLCGDCTGNAFVCKRCGVFGFDLRDGISPSTCQYPLCGDKIIFPHIQECDDGNNRSLDGCSSTCRIEPSFICTNSSFQRQDYRTTTHCSYTKSPTMTFKSLQKLSGVNQLRMILNINKNESYMLENVNLANAFKSQKILQLMSASVQNSNPTNFNLSSVARLLQTSSPSDTYDLTLLFSYSYPVQGLPYTFTFDFSALGLPIFQGTPLTSISINLTPQNNLLANYYTPEQYSYAGSIALAAIIISCIGILVFLASLLFDGKVITIEMMGVAQLAYISLFGSGILNPSLEGLTAFKFSNGFNSISAVRPFDTPNNSPQLIGLALYPTFLNNFNISTLFVFIPLIIAGVFQIMSKWFQKKMKAKKAKKYQAYSMTSLKEYTFAGVLFTAYAVDTSFIVNFIYGTQNMNASAIISILFALIFFCIQIGYIILTFRQPSQFGQFANVSSKKSPISRAFFGWMLITRMLTAILLPALSMLSVINMLPLLIHLIGIIVIVVKWPYEQLKDNVRSIANCICVIIIEGLFVTQRLTNQNADTRSLQLMIPVTIAAIVIICIAVNSVMAIRVMFKKLRSQQTPLTQKQELMGKKIQDNQSDDEQLKKYRQEIYNDTTNPLNYLSQKAKFAQNDEGRDQSVRGLNEECQAPNAGEQFQSIRKKKQTVYNNDAQFADENSTNSDKYITERNEQELNHLRKAANMKLAEISLAQKGKYEYTDKDYCLDNEYDRI